MKKTPLCILCAILGVMIGAGAFWLISTVVGPQDINAEPSLAILSEDSSVTTNETLTGLALQVAGYIKSGEFDRLSQLVHPEYGVVISPYATVNLSSNKCFTAEEVADFSRNTDTYTWGITSDSREPIDMTVSDYFQSYVFDFDYTTSSVIGVNYIIKSGNSLENVTDIFPGAQFIDLCNPGTGGSGSTDWSTLRLVFEDYNGSLMLTAIIHSEYTI